MDVVNEINVGGRPSISEKQYEIWLEELRPFLVKGFRLYSACINTGLQDKYHSCIYAKYRKGDWFSKKIQDYQSILGDTINDFFATELYRISDKQKSGELITKEELEIMKYMASHHRTAQQFFVQRIEYISVKKSRKEILVKPAKIEYSDRS